MHPTLIDLGFFALPTYGVLLVVGLTLGLLTARSRANATGLPGDRVLDLGLWVVLWGLVGSKVLLVLTEPGYLSSWRSVLGLVRAGGVFYGGLLGAMAAAAVLLHRWRLPALPLVDALVPSVALGHFFGRLGCFAAGCCYGSACGHCLSVTFSDAKAAELSGTPLHLPLHPVQVYEAGFNLLNYLLLAWLFRRRLRPGAVLAVYLITYGVARFGLEFLRGDPDRGFVLGGLFSTSQLIAALLVPAGLGLLVWVRRHRE